MTIAENADDRLSYKFYASGAITAGSEPVPSSAPGATGAQVLRHVSHNLALAKDYFTPNEKRTDGQKALGRHGTRRAPGTINCLLSPLTYADFFEASFRGTWSVATVTIDQSDVTSVSADNATSKFTFASGDPVALGLRVGDPIRFSTLSDADNNGKNFVILAFGGTSNREVTVYPAPDTMSADTGFSLTTAGRSLIIPSSGHVSRLLAVEDYNPGADIASLYTEGRIGGFSLRLPPNDNASVDFTTMFRNRVLYQGSSAPFFTSPTDETTTDFCAAVNGLIRVNGETLGVVTGLNINLSMDPNGPSVSGSKLVPDIFLPDATVSGDFSAFLDADAAALIGNFDDEDEISVIAYLPSTEAAAAPAITVHLPRIKLNSSSTSDDQSGGRVVNFQYVAGRYFGSTAGVESTSLRICDTEVS